LYGVELAVELVLAGVVAGVLAGSPFVWLFSSSTGETSPRSIGVEEAMEGDEADMGDVEGIDSFTKVRRRLMRLDDWKRLTVLTPSRIAVRTSAQTFFPSSHFDTADENRYDSRRPVTVQAASQCSVNFD